MFSFYLLHHAVNDQSDDDSSASVAKNGCSSDKDEGKLDVKDDGHLEQDSVKPWLSPCRDVPKQIPGVTYSPTYDIQEDKEGNKRPTAGKTSARKKVAEKLKFGDSLESGIQEEPDKSKISLKEKRQTPIRSSGVSENRKQKTPASKSFPESKSHASPKAVNSSSCLLSSNNLVDSAAENAKDSELKTHKKARLSLSTLVRSFALSSEHKKVASSSSNADDDDVFEDYFSPANHKRPILPNLAEESNIEIPFELDSVAKTRKQRRSDSSVAYNKKLKMEESHNGKKPNQRSDEGSECPGKRDGKTSLSASNCSSVHVTAKSKRRRRSTLGFISTGDKRKCSSASTSGQPSSQTEDVPELEQQELTDFTSISHTGESE